MTKEDYIGEDGLLHCGICDVAKEAYISPDNIWGKDRRSRNCRCIREYYDAQKAEDEHTDHLQKVDELRRNCFSYSNYANVTFENSKTQNRQFVYCQDYVNNWAESKENNIGLLFWGDVGTGKTYLAACIANALIE